MGRPSISTTCRILPPRRAMVAKYEIRLFPPDRPNRWEVGCRLGAALRRALSKRKPTALTGTHASSRPHIRRAHWHSFWTGKRDQPDARSAILKWLPPIPVDVQDVEELTTTARAVGGQVD